MTNGVMIGIFFLVLLLLMLSGMPIAYSLGIASALYMVYMKTSLAMVAQRMVNGGYLRYRRGCRGCACRLPDHR